MLVLNQFADADLLSAYVSEFPTGALLGHPKVLLPPHLGASTREAEENCALMAQLAAAEGILSVRYLSMA